MLCACRGAEATADELSALQERALWDLLSLFFLESSSSGGGGGGEGMVAQVGRQPSRQGLQEAGVTAAAPLLGLSRRDIALVEASWGWRQQQAAGGVAS